MKDKKYLAKWVIWIILATVFYLPIKFYVLHRETDLKTYSPTELSRRYQQQKVEHIHFTLEGITSLFKKSDNHDASITEISILIHKYFSEEISDVAFRDSLVNLHGKFYVQSWEETLKKFPKKPFNKKIIHEMVEAKKFIHQKRKKNEKEN